jgi:carbon monoxide dehydrogenase subunit G
LAQTEYATSARLPVDEIWDFVRDMDNWAPFVAGYQRHEKQNDDDSTWTLKGDVGVLARTLSFRVHVTEWAGPDRVTFRLEGVNEPMTGEGSFTLERWEPGAPAAEGGGSEGPAARPGRGFFARLAERVARFFYRLFRGRVQRAASADEGPAAGASRMTFRIRLDPGGPMAPMVNAMIQPMMLPAAEELADSIMAELEQRRGIA